MPWGCARQRVLLLCLQPGWVQQICAGCRKLLVTTLQRWLFLQGDGFVLTAGLTASLQLCEHRGKQQRGEGSPSPFPSACVRAPLRQHCEGAGRHCPAKHPAPAGRDPCLGKGQSRFLQAFVPLVCSPGRAIAGAATPRANPPGAVGFAQPPCECCGGSRHQQCFKVTKSGPAKAAASPRRTRMLFSPKVQHRNDKDRGVPGELNPRMLLLNFCLG